MSEVVEILNKIAENTKPDNKAIWVALITSASTLLGAGIGAILLYFGTSKQAQNTRIIEERKLQVNIITTERLRWLQELRQKSSEFYANLDMNYSLLKRPLPAIQYQDKADEISKQVMAQCNQILVILNPKKPHQGAMCMLCNEALAFFQDCVVMRNNPGNYDFDDSKYTEIKTDYFASLVEIGIETWTQIKELK